MRLFISLIIVWTVSGATLAAANEMKTIGDMRAACKDARNVGTIDDALYTGICIGWIKAQSDLRSRLCAMAGQEDGKTVIGPFGFVEARDTSSHTVEALIQGFLNWADDNPERWSRSLHNGVMSNDFWSEFPCKAIS
jgi:hypothetical protein